MQEQSLIRIGISIGDLNGIGPEVALRCFQDKRMLELCTPVFFASAKAINFYIKNLNLNLKFQGIKHPSQAIEGKINVFNCWKEDYRIDWGKQDPESGTLAIRSFTAATRALKENHIDALVTAPIHKYNSQTEDFKFPGHTDYLNQELEGNALMFMVSESIKVGLLTDHVAVKDVPSNITKASITSKVKAIVNSLKQDYALIKPKVAVLSINPHVGDNGVIGKEDDEVLRPALASLREEGYITYGPYAADSFFGSGNYKNFDAVLASYHDQGLIPFKTLTFGSGVNYTAGLEKVRTSPDHGTAFDIAGTGKADESSFSAAVFEAIKIYKNRAMHEKISANPLKTVVKTRPSR